MINEYLLRYASNQTKNSYFVYEVLEPEMFWIKYFQAIVWKTHRDDNNIAKEMKIAISEKPTTFDEVLNGFVAERDDVRERLVKNL